MSTNIVPTAMPDTGIKATSTKITIGGAAAGLALFLFNYASGAKGLHSATVTVTAAAMAILPAIGKQAHDGILRKAFIQNVGSDISQFIPVFQKGASTVLDAAENLIPGLSDDVAEAKARITGLEHTLSEKFEAVVPAVDQAALKALVNEVVGARFAAAFGGVTTNASPTPGAGNAGGTPSAGAGGVAGGAA